MTLALSKDQKRAAVREWKERKPAYGIYAVRCSATGEVWVGATRDLHAAPNGLFFTLRTGVHRELRLQQEWTRHGEPAFAFEVLETLKEDTAQLLIAGLLKERKLHWAAQLSAGLLL
ncbi:MAG TPA: GIY-YIG nuclease family protein [Bryobacteraceae bacterium]|nr:GIY-YIG nuclease family protein [Bryobacteraceae bacterium]